MTIADISNSLLPVNQTRYLTIASVNPSTPLPLRLLEFTASKSNKSTVQLDWITNMEINFSHFEVERSLDGAAWEQLGIVQGRNRAGVSSYQFEDEMPRQGLNYYRLKMVDRDADYEYSPVRSVNIAGRANRITIHPNPVDDEIIITDGNYEPGEVSVSDMMGRDLRAQISLTTINENVTVINVSQLASGMYLLRIKQQAFKVIKR